MNASPLLRTIGLMSGTSMDGIDAAYVETDGVRAIHRGEALTVPYDPDFRARLKAFTQSNPAKGSGGGLEAELTDLHADAVRTLLARLGKTAQDIDLVGFHGQTIWHRPEQRETWQMGDGARLARALGVRVAFDFRSADVQAGGQGAPLLPIFHAALMPANDRPVAILNIGGVANVTWIDAQKSTDASDAAAEAVFAVLIGFDTGPGNGLVDDWIMTKRGLAMDKDGAIAAKGRINDAALRRLMDHPYFTRKPPKSLDRFAFSPEPVAGLSLEDGAATLTAFTAASVARGLAQCPSRPELIFVAGGGRHNATLMRMLAEYTGAAVASVDVLGWQGDALEAQAFGYFAVRCARGLPITFPGTTGAKAPLAGGRIAEPC
jgi:anhydro-N-acetylmuramic acid kinase